MTNTLFIYLIKCIYLSLFFLSFFSFHTFLSFYLMRLSASGACILLLILPISSLTTWLDLSKQLIQLRDSKSKCFDLIITKWWILLDNDGQTNAEYPAIKKKVKKKLWMKKKVEMTCTSIHIFVRDGGFECCRDEDKKRNYWSDRYRLIIVLQKES